MPCPSYRSSFTCLLVLFMLIVAAIGWLTFMAFVLLFARHHIFAICQLAFEGNLVDASWWLIIGVAAEPLEDELWLPRNRDIVAFKFVKQSTRVAQSAIFRTVLWCATLLTLTFVSRGQSKSLSWRFVVPIRHIVEAFALIFWWEGGIFS